MQVGFEFSSKYVTQKKLKMMLRWKRKIVLFNTLDDIKLYISKKLSLLIRNIYNLICFMTEHQQVARNSSWNIECSKNEALLAQLRSP